MLTCMEEERINMWNQKKKYKKIAVGVLLVLALAFGAGQWRFQSVDSYREEQKQAAKELGLEEGQFVQDGEWNGSEAGEHLEKEREEKDGKGTGEKKKNEAKNNKKQKNEKGEAIKPAGDSSDKKNGSGAKQGEKKNNHSSQSGKDKSSGKSGDDQKDKKPSTGGSGKDSETAGSGADSSGENSTSSGEAGSTSDSSNSSGGDNEKPGKDTSATPDNEKPAAASTTKPPQEKITCTIQIRCDSLVANKNKIDSELWKYIPFNGMILAETKITVDKGTSAYDALNQVCKAKNIAMDSEYTAMYKSYYVKGIGHLYEKQAGDMSGWIYKVNGKAPNKGSSSFILSDGDSITWAYTCDGKTT